MRSLVCMIAALAGWLADPAAAADDYAGERAAALKKCDAVDPDAYQSGLAFNPDGLRSYYLRSACIQEVAARYRDETLCAQVKERWTLLWSSWGYSPEQCRKLVAEGQARDRKTLEETLARDAKGGVKLRDFWIDRYGNKQDFNIVPVFERGPEFERRADHRYTVRFDLVDEGATGGSVPLASFERLLYGNEDMRIPVRQDEIRQRFPGFELDHRYLVRATMTLEVGNRGMGGMWSDAFRERVLPAAARSQVLEKQLTFRPW